MIFKKIYLPEWTEEVFMVSCITPGAVNTYKVKEMDNTPVRDTFYGQELPKVQLPGEASYHIEKVLIRNKRQ